MMFIFRNAKNLIRKKDFFNKLYKILKIQLFKKDRLL